MIMLEGVANESGHRFGLLDKLYIALAWGFGHSVCHSVRLALSRVWGEGLRESGCSRCVRGLDLSSFPSCVDIMLVITSVQCFTLPNFASPLTDHLLPLSIALFLPL